MSNQEKVEREVEKRRDEVFNETHPIIPSKVWVPKRVEDTMVTLVVTTTHAPSEEDNMSMVASPTPVTALPAIDEISEPASIEENEEEMVDYEDTPDRRGMDMNMVYYLPAEFRAVDEERGGSIAGSWSQKCHL